MAKNDKHNTKKWDKISYYLSVFQRIEYYLNIIKT